MGVFKDDDLAFEAWELEYVLDRAPDRGDVRHALVPPLRRDFDQHDVIDTDDRANPAKLAKHGIDVRRRDPALADVQRRFVFDRIVWDQWGGRRERRNNGFSIPIVEELSPYGKHSTGRCDHRRTTDSVSAHRHHIGCARRKFAVELAKCLHGIDKKKMR